MQDCVFKAFAFAWSSPGPAKSFALEALEDARRYSQSRETFTWVIPRLLRACWPREHAENHDADDNSSYGRRKAVLEEWLADLIRVDLPEVPWP